MKKLFNNKQGQIGLIIIAVIAIVAVFGGSATYNFFSNRDLGDTKYCVLENGKEVCYKPTQTTFVDKTCFTEGGGCDETEIETNTPLEFRRVCKLLQNKRGKNTDAYFLVSKNGLSCLSCSDYYKDESLFDGAKLDPIARVSKASCEAGGLVTDEARCDNEADCNKKLSEEVNILDVEDHVKQAKSPEERAEKTEDNPCPDIKIGFSAIPDYFCKAEQKLKTFFTPFRIMFSIVGAIAGWLLVLWLFTSTIKIKQKKAIMPIAIVMGLIIGAFIWFIWYVGLALLLIILILRAFIWK